MLQSNGLNRLLPHIPDRPGRHDPRIFRHHQHNISSHHPGISWPKRDSASHALADRLLHDPGSVQVTESPRALPASFFIHSRSSHYF